MRWVISLFTKCSSVLTSLLLISRSPSLGSPYAAMQPFLPFWAAGTHTTGCHSHGRYWLGQDMVALLPTAQHGLLQAAAGNRGRGFGRLPIGSAGHLAQGVQGLASVKK